MFLSTLILESEDETVNEQRDKLKALTLSSIETCELVKRVDQETAVPVGNGKPIVTPC